MFTMLEIISLPPSLPTATRRFCTAGPAPQIPEPLTKSTTSPVCLRGRKKNIFFWSKRDSSDGHSLTKKKEKRKLVAFAKSLKSLEDDVSSLRAKPEYPRQQTTVNESEFPYVTTGVLAVSLRPAALVCCTTLIRLPFLRHQNPRSFIQPPPHLLAERAFIASSGSASQGPSRLICI